MTNAALLNQFDEVVFTADVPEGVREVEVAGTTDANGYPVNVKTFKVSRSKKNMAKTAEAELVKWHKATDALGYTKECYV